MNKLLLMFWSRMKSNLINFIYVLLRSQWSCFTTPQEVYYTYELIQHITFVFYWQNTVSSHFFGPPWEKDCEPLFYGNGSMEGSKNRFKMVSLESSPSNSRCWCCRPERSVAAVAVVTVAVAAIYLNLRFVVYKMSLTTVSLLIWPYSSDK